MKQTKIIFTLLLLTITTLALSKEYKIDTKGMHAAVQFKISHLGTSWLMGRFDRFDGTFSYDAKHPNDAKISMTVDTSSVNTNHAERDAHIRDKRLLDTDNFPKATFVSDSIQFNEDGTGTATGKFTLHGVAKTIKMAIKKVGEGVDPWGGYRAGFEGKMTIRLSDYDINRNLGKASQTLELHVTIEGIRQKAQ